MKRMRTTLVNNKEFTRKMIVLFKAEDGTWSVEVETGFRGRHTTEVVVSGEDASGAHFYYVQQIMKWHGQGYLIELGGMAAYE